MVSVAVQWRLLLGTLVGLVWIGGRGLTWALGDDGSASWSEEERENIFFEDLAGEHDYLLKESRERAASAPFYSEGDSIFAAVGPYHTCALEYRPGVDFGGSARCWGRNSVGEASPPLDDTFIQLAAGDRHTCGLRTDQTITCWGAPFMTSSPPRGLYQQITSGPSHACALTLDGEAECWGDGVHGKLEVPEGVRFLSLAAGGSFSCGLRIDNAAQCWGHNNKGQASPPPKQRFRQIAASHTDHACGVTLEEGANILCWGANMRGEGDGREGPWQQVTVGRRFTCGIRETDGSAECWGLMSNYPGTIEDPLEELTAGLDHVCGVTSEGELLCWGSGSGFGAETVPDGFESA